MIVPVHFENLSQTQLTKGFEGVRLMHQNGWVHSIFVLSIGKTPRFFFSNRQETP